MKRPYKLFYHDLDSMVNLKSLFLNFFAITLFTISFGALFVGISLYFLPQDFQEFRTSVENELPTKLANSPTIDRLVEESLPLEEISDQDFQLVLQGFYLQCQIGAIEDEFIESMCDDILAGRIHTKDDVVQLAKEKLITSQLEGALKGPFDEMEGTVRETQQFLPLVLIVFLVTAVLGSLIVLIDTWNIKYCIHNLAGYALGYSFFTFLPLLLLWIALPFVVNEWLLDQVMDVVTQELESQAGSMMELDQIMEVVQELVQIIGQFMVELLQKLIFKHLVIWGIVAFCAFVVYLLTWGKKKKKEKKKDQK